MMPANVVTLLERRLPTLAEPPAATSQINNLQEIAGRASAEQNVGQLPTRFAMLRDGDCG